MVLTLKVISAAVCYQDGRPEKQDDLRESQKKNQIRDLPSPITFLGYCLNCGTHLAGPVYEIKDYIDWAENLTLLYTLSNIAFMFSLLSNNKDRASSLG
jgi:lysophospholipid acyltransferase